MKRISKGAFAFTMGDWKVTAEKATLSIEDNRKAVKDGGVPNGWVDGEVAASGEIELDSRNFSLLTEGARATGAWQLIDLVDLLFYAKTASEEQKVEAFGCLLNLSDVMDLDATSDAKATVKIPYEVTSPDFVKLNGVPYLDPARIQDL